MNYTSTKVTEMPTRLQEDFDTSGILQIVENQKHSRGALIAVLEEIQAEYGYLPEPALRTLAKVMNRSLVDIYGVATFYRSFSLQPRGKCLISVCLGTACHVRGAPMVVEEFERQLGICVGETTLDREFTLETVNCLGACALGPIVSVNGHYFANVNTAKVKNIIRKARRGIPQMKESVA